MSEKLKLYDISANAVAEGARVMTICNACRYCEGFCPVFPAMSHHRTFDGATLDYLANLCHNCTACYHACQYKPPHEFSVSVPAVFSEIRERSYRHAAWPSAAGHLFENNARFTSLVVIGVVALTCLGMLLYTSPAILDSAHSGEGAFYRVLSHTAMAGIPGVITFFGLLSLSISTVSFGRRIGLQRGDVTTGSRWFRVLGSVATLEHLGGGHGEGCNTKNEAFSNRRRFYHQCTMWGFLLCFAATCTATLYEFVLGRMPPFGYTSLPVLFGTIGGIGLIIGPVGLLGLHRSHHPEAMPAQASGMDRAFLIQLLGISSSGLVLMALRNSTLMPWLLTLHLGLVFAFFVTLPFSKFVHGIYRLLALLRYAGEQQSGQQEQQ